MCAEVFAKPSYNEGPDEVNGFLKCYHRELRVPGFRLALLRDGHGIVAAFAYGLPLSPNTSWWGGFLDTTLPEE